MMKTQLAILVLTGLSLEALLVGTARAQTVTFDFDTGPAPPSVYSSLPVDQTLGGVTAHFEGAFSFQTDSTTFFKLSQFSGKYLDPTSLSTRGLDITFDRDLAAISAGYATIDYQDNREIPSDIRLTAFANSNTVGSVTTHAQYTGDTYPMGIITLTSARPFNKVTILVPFQPSSLMLFLADNITVTVMPTLKISLDATNAVVISWPAAATGFRLQENASLTGTNWVDTSGATNVVGDLNTVTIPPPGGSCYYRLVNP